MSRMNLVWGLVAACAAALITGVMQTVLWHWVGGAMAVRMLAVALPLAYVAFLLAFAEVRTGRIVLATGALLGLTTAFFAPVSLTLVLAVAGASVWLVRSVCYHKTIAGAVADGVLVVGGLAAALAAFAATRSISSAVWAAMLTQSIFVFIPRFGQPATATGGVAAAESDKFQRAYNAAETALREIAAR